MALTNAERQRRHYYRTKQMLRQQPDDTAEILETAFCDFLRDHGKAWRDEAVQALDEVGIVPPAFGDDSDEHWHLYGEEDRGSIGRAERMVGAFLDSASALAKAINDYKREEITRAITAIEQSDLTDPAARKKALAEMVRLTKLRDRLDKQVRWTLPEWKVKGD
jgi:hypothetical protein